MKVPRTGILLLFMCAGCTTIEQREAAEQSRFSSFNGMTMAAFTSETLITPHDFYDAQGVRVFIAYKSAPDPRLGCKMLIRARNTGAGTTADDWAIQGITRQGGCAGI